MLTEKIIKLKQILKTNVAVAKSLKISSSYVSKLVNNKYKIKSKKSKVTNRLNNRIKYYKRKNFFQPRIKIKVSKYDYPVWISGDVSELDDVETTYEDLFNRLSEKYEEFTFIKEELKRYKKK